jgi:signal transduction histidine kinase
MQILVNLASNGVKFTESGKITITASLDQEQDDQVALHFEIDDTGEGMSVPDQARIFKAFEQRPMVPTPASTVPRPWRWPGVSTTT